MNLQEFILFIASSAGGNQYFFLCPATIQSYWDDFKKENINCTDMDELSKWVDTVPPTMRKKIQVFKGHFVNIPKIEAIPKSFRSKEDDHVIMDLTGIHNRQGTFNPFLAGKQIEAMKEPVKAKKLKPKLR